jgi:hypothetical protein
MKNIIQLGTKSCCHNCNTNGFYIFTPQGGDYTTCPSCMSPDFWSAMFYSDEQMNKQMGAYHDKYYKQKSDEYDMLPDNDVLPNFHEYLYCYACRIIYNVGCRHAVNGCTDDTYNCHIIGKWKYKDEIYIGMPQFDTFDEYISEINKIEVLEIVCLRNEGNCERAHYKSDKYPEYYHECKYRKSDCVCLP